MPPSEVGQPCGNSEWWEMWQVTWSREGNKLLLVGVQHITRRCSREEENGWPSCSNLLVVLDIEILLQPELESLDLKFEDPWRIGDISPSKYKCYKLMVITSVPLVLNQEDEQAEVSVNWIGLVQGSLWHCNTQHVAFFEIWIQF